MLRKQRAAKLMVEHKASSIIYQFPDPTKFARMLGKIAYGFAVACDGLKATREAPLLAAILNGGPSIFDHVGNDDGPNVIAPSLGQEALMGTGENGRVVRVRLLPSPLAPEYVVFVDQKGAV
jgi:hypothetical protein